MLSFVALLLTISARYVTANSTGAPPNICGHYIPRGHNNTGTPVANGLQTGPYTLTVIPSENGNRLYKVTLKNTTAEQPFMGFLVQAFSSSKQFPEAASDIIGSFAPQSDQTQVRTCRDGNGSNVLTHTAKTDKYNIEATWQAPETIIEHSVKFIATVVRNIDNFYVIHSEPIDIQVQGSSGGQGAGNSGSTNNGGPPGQTSNDGHTQTTTGTTTSVSTSKVTTPNPESNNGN